MRPYIKKKIYNTQEFKRFQLPEKTSDQVFITGLQGSLQAFLLSYLVEIYHKPVVYLTSDQDSAEKIRDDLEILLTNHPVAFFPAWERVPYDDHEPNPSLVRLRLETLQNLITTKESVIVCTLPGIMSQVAAPDHFIDQQHYIKKKSSHHFDHLINNLFAAGYSRTDIVEDVGHFAVRGGILDIFPWTSNDPVRIEFFGD